MNPEMIFLMHLEINIYNLEIRIIYLEMNFKININKYHLEMHIISRWCAYRDDIYFKIHIVSRYEYRNKYHLDMLIILRCIPSWDDMHLHLKMHIVSRFISSRDKYNLKIYIIWRWYASWNDMHLEIIFISRWYESRD